MSKFATTLRDGTYQHEFAASLTVGLQARADTLGAYQVEQKAYPNSPLGVEFTQFKSTVFEP